MTFLELREEFSRTLGPGMSNLPEQLGLQAVKLDAIREQQSKRMQSAEADASGEQHPLEVQ